MKSSIGEEKAATTGRSVGILGHRGTDHAIGHRRVEAGAADLKRETLPPSIVELALHQSNCLWGLAD